MRPWQIRAAEKGRKLALEPPMLWWMRLSILAVGYLTDATHRADDSINRHVLSFLDPRVAASAAPRNGVASRDLAADPTLPLWARLFHPVGPAAAPAARLPIIVFFHGGRFAYLSATSPTYDAACRYITKYSGAVVLSVDYSRSPEHRFPAAYDDDFSALRFLDDPTNHLNIDGGGQVLGRVQMNYVGALLVVLTHEDIYSSEGVGLLLHLRYIADLVIEAAPLSTSLAADVLAAVGGDRVFAAASLASSYC